MTPNIHLYHIFNAKMFGVEQTASDILALVVLLVTKCEIGWSNRHQLHRESKHHQDHQDRDNAECLWHGVPPFDSVDLKAEEIDSNLYYSIQNTNKSVQKNDHEKDCVQEQLYVVEALVTG